MAAKLKVTIHSAGVPYGTEVFAKSIDSDGDAYISTDDGANGYWLFQGQYKFVSEEETEMAEKNFVVTVRVDHGSTEDLFNTLEALRDFIGLDDVTVTLEGDN